jgi:hypothetical protein
MSRKVLLHFNEGADAELHMTLKLTLPKKWVLEQSPVKVLEVCCSQPAAVSCKECYCMQHQLPQIPFAVASLV